MVSKCIQIRVETKDKLDSLKLVKMESYDSVIQRLVEYKQKNFNAYVDPDHIHN